MSQAAIDALPTACNALLTHNINTTNDHPNSAVGSAIFKQLGYTACRRRPLVSWRPAR